MRGYHAVLASLLACFAAAAPAFEASLLDRSTPSGQTQIVLRPCGHPSVDLADVDNLKATKGAQLHYDSNTDPSVDSSVAIVHSPTSELPIVQLESTSHIKSMTCTDTTATIVFSNATAYQTAAHDWNHQSNFIMVSYSPSCGSGHDQSKRDFVLVKSVTVDSRKWTIDADIEFVDFSTAFGKSTVVRTDLGKYVAPLLKRGDISKSETFNWNNYPTDSLTDSQWGSGYQLLSDSTLNMVCVGCGTQGSMTLTGSFSWSWFSVKSADITLAGSMQATVQVGIHSTGTHVRVPINTSTLVQIPLGGIDIPGIIDIGPQINVNAGATIEVDAIGDLLVGATLNWPNVSADCNIYGGSSSGSGFQPTITPVNQANGTVSVTLDLHLPVSIGIGVNVLNGLWNKQIALVDSPGVQITGTDSNANDCNGIDLSANVYNDVGVNILGITTIPITGWTAPLFNTCLGISTTSAAAVTTSTTAAAAVTTTAADSTVITASTSTGAAQTSTTVAATTTGTTATTSATITAPPTTHYPTASGSGSPPSYSANATSNAASSSSGFAHSSYSHRKHTTLLISSYPAQHYSHVSVPVPANSTSSSSFSTTLLAGTYTRHHPHHDSYSTTLAAGLTTFTTSSATPYHAKASSSSSSSSSTSCTDEEETNPTLTPPSSRSARLARRAYKA